MLSHVVEVLASNDQNKPLFQYYIDWSGLVLSSRLLPEPAIFTSPPSSSSSSSASSSPPPTTTFHKPNQSNQSIPSRPTYSLSPFHPTPTPPPIPASQKTSIPEPRRRDKKGKSLYFWAIDAIVTCASDRVEYQRCCFETSFVPLSSLSLPLSLPLILPTSSANPKPSSTHTPG